MTEIHHKLPDTRKSRWWRIPSPSREYKKGYDRIFKKVHKKRSVDGIYKLKI